MEARDVNENNAKAGDIGKAGGPSESKKEVEGGADGLMVCLCPLVLR